MCEHYHPLSTNDRPQREAAFTRRHFLQTGLVMVSTLASVPGFVTQTSTAMADTSMRLASKPGVPEDRVLVVVQLSGGNDGLNTLIPFGDDAYHRARPAIGIKEADLLPLDSTRGIGLHSALRPVHDLLGEGRAAVLQGVGYPNPNRSHFTSMDIWHTADPAQADAARRARGWIGRALDPAAADAAGLACIGIGDEAPLAGHGDTVKPVTFSRADLFRWAGRDADPAIAQAYEQLQAAPPQDTPGTAATFLHRTAMDAQVASDRVRAAVTKGPETAFPRNNPLAQQLQHVAAMIRAELPTRVYYVGLGGFDTHAGQGWRHARLLGQFADAMHAFDAELAATGHRSRVVTLAFSEFGRRVAQNASGGTDHGAAGPVFLFGDAVRPGLLGEAPSLTDLDRGDLRHTTDFRSVYAALLDGWLKLDSRQALGGTFASAPILRA